jgi:predicted SprT family Zn-dependent metalloprotease
MSQPEDEKLCSDSALDGEASSGDVVFLANDRLGLRSEPKAFVSYDTTDPTCRTYSELTDAYAFFNARLFSDQLPPCLITLQRRKKSYGYFSGERFTTRNGAEVADEIALNPSFFAECSIEDIFSTLVHEMVHLQQQHFGTPSRAGYHNKQWAQMMRAVGLIPSDTGEPGGKGTGQSVSHYIEEGGRFALACAELVDVRGGTVPYIELGSEIERGTREQKAASKTKYTCPVCGANAWAKPETELDCRACKQPMEAAPAKMTSS